MRCRNKLLLAPILIVTLGSLLHPGAIKLSKMPLATLIKLRMDALSARRAGVAKNLAFGIPNKCGHWSPPGVELQSAVCKQIELTQIAEHVRVQVEVFRKHFDPEDRWLIAAEQALVSTQDAVATATRKISQLQAEVEKANSDRAQYLSLSSELDDLQSAYDKMKK